MAEAEGTVCGMWRPPTHTNPGLVGDLRSDYQLEIAVYRAHSAKGPWWRKRLGRRVILLEGRCRPHSDGQCEGTVSVHSSVHCLQSAWEQSSNFEKPRIAQSVKWLGSEVHERATVVWFCAEERHFFFSKASRPAKAHPTSYSTSIKGFFLRHQSKCSVKLTTPPSLLSRRSLTGAIPVFWPMLSCCQQCQLCLNLSSVWHLSSERTPFQQAAVWSQNIETAMSVVCFS